MPSFRRNFYLSSWLVAGAQPTATVAKQLHVVEAAAAGPQSDTGPVASAHRPVGLAGVGRLEGKCAG